MTNTKSKHDEEEIVLRRTWMKKMERMGTPVFHLQVKINEIVDVINVLIDKITELEDKIKKQE